ncbi:MAG TPA: FAD-dependent oxidoreductase [Candidatus Nitrosotenuis sp.]|jgi:thioredoxin reductase (NADPH)|nr:FAD-dependent oxidoreductase [Candidatus Nitrosotenuis sp.]
MTAQPTEVTLLIAGTGCAGHTAAIYAARANLAPLVLEGREPGGQLSLTSEVENFPGFPEAIGGFELTQRMREQAERFGALYQAGEITALKTLEPPFQVEVDGSRIVRCQALILATGARARRLGVPGEDLLFGRGVSTCATCDGAFFRGQSVVVVGGGDSACEEAIFLTRFASEVHLVHRRDRLRASIIMQERCLSHPKVRVHWNTEVLEILGSDEGVTGVRLATHPLGNPAQRLRSAGGAAEAAGVRLWDLPCEGVFLAIGHVPNSEFLRGKIDLDEEGYIRPRRGGPPTQDVLTSVEGIFAAGDVVDRRYKQAVTAAAMGCKAAMEAERYLAAREEAVAARRNAP